MIAQMSVQVILALLFNIKCIYPSAGIGRQDKLKIY